MSIEKLIANVPNSICLDAMRRLGDLLGKIVYSLQIDRSVVDCISKFCQSVSKQILRKSSHLTWLDKLLDNDCELLVLKEYCLYET